MSRHEVRAYDHAHRVIVGWDHPSLTFFVQVIDRTREAAGDDEKIIVWRGTNLREIYEVDHLVRIASRYAEISPELGSTFYGDKDEGR